MSESEFLSLIDCRFPYHKPAEAKRLIVLGCSISPNAAFMVVNELVHLPASVTVTTETRLALLRQVDRHLVHPLKDLILDVAAQFVSGIGLSLPQTIDSMKAVALFPNQYSALAVVSGSGKEPWEETDALFNHIIQRWEATA